MNQPPPLPEANPYAAPAARVIDPLQTDTQELADRGTRLGAAIVDGMIYLVVIGLPVVVLPVMFGRQQRDETAGIVLAFVVGALFIGLLVVNGVMLHRHGQTIAKRLFKIKIVRGDGSRCGLTRVIFARWLPVALLGAIPFVGYIVSLLDPLLIFREDYRCLHDHIADTVVVKV